MFKKNGAIIANIAETLWQTYPAHYDAHSKPLVSPATTGSKYFDYRISTYLPKGYVEPHHHKVQEQIYHILEGEGVMELDGERIVVRRQDYIFVPPGVEHAIYNSGLDNLVFLVITSPASDD